MKIDVDQVVEDYWNLVLAKETRLERCEWWNCSQPAVNHSLYGRLCDTHWQHISSLPRGDAGKEAMENVVRADGMLPRVLVQKSGPKRTKRRRPRKGRVRR